MIQIKKYISLVWLWVFALPAFSYDYESGNEELLAQRSGERTEKKTTSRVEKTSRSVEGNSSRSEDKTSKPKDERPSRPKDERPSRTNGGNHVSSARDPHHHSEPPHHPHSHHHGHEHGGAVVSTGTVVVVEDDVEYANTSSDYSSVPDGDYAIDKFMLYANIGCGLSYRGVSGRVDDEAAEEEEEADFFSNSLGYNIEVRFDIGLAKHFYMTSGIGFTRHSVSNVFFPGNYMISTKRFCDIPLMFGYRKSSVEDFIAAVALGPRFAYGINGTCREYYDFFPDPDYGVFEHDSYGGKYGVKKFSIGAGIEANFVLYRFLLGCNFSVYPKNECDPGEIYDGLYRRLRNCRTNFTIKAGWRLF